LQKKVLKQTELVEQNKKIGQTGIFYTIMSEISAYKAISNHHEK